MSTISANTFLAADGTTTTEPSIPALDQRMAAAWVNFNGNGTDSIKNSYNVSSVTDVALGRSRVNFISGMPNLFYSTAGMGSVQSSNASWATMAVFDNYSILKSVDFAQVTTVNYQNVQVDCNDVSVIVFSN